RPGARRRPARSRTGPEAAPGPRADRTWPADAPPGRPRGGRGAPGAPRGRTLAIRARCRGTGLRGLVVRHPVGAATVRDDVAPPRCSGPRREQPAGAAPRSPGLAYVGGAPRVLSRSGACDVAVGPR